MSRVAYPSSSVRHGVRPAAGVLRRAPPRRGGAPGARRGAGVRGHLQLRGLPGGRRQPRGGRHPGLPRHGAAALRHDLLRLPHRALLRRPPRRRLHRYVSNNSVFRQLDRLHTPES